jgi:hypothetical protein
MESYCSICTLDTILRLFFATRLMINKNNIVQWVDFMLENVLVSLHSLITWVSAPLFLRNGELLEHSPIQSDWLNDSWAKQYLIVVQMIWIKKHLYKIQVTVCAAQYLLFSEAFDKLLFVFLLFFYRPLSCLFSLSYLKTFLRRILTAPVQQSDACFQYLFC